MTLKIIIGIGTFSNDSRTGGPLAHDRHPTDVPRPADGAHSRAPASARVKQALKSGVSHAGSHAMDDIKLLALLKVSFGV